MSVQNRVALAAHVRLRVEYLDESELGTAISGRCDDSLRALLPEIEALRRERGLRHIVRESEALLAHAARHPVFSGRPGLPDAFLYPDPHAARPARLIVEPSGAAPLCALELTPALASDLARWCAEWTFGAPAPRTPDAARLFEALQAAGALQPIEDGERARASLADAALVGHATLCFSDGDDRVLIDPFLFPRAAHYPGGYQPLSAVELGRPTAILLTHSHPDHFDPGSLLRFGADVPIYVPLVARESVLAIDMVARLRELGFSKVEPMAWFEQRAIGRITVRALPFYGEQPAVQDVLHPEVRNIGNTYLISCGGRRYGVTADSGRDQLGDLLSLAKKTRSEQGPIDVLFGGYRGFAFYPIQYLYSSVARFLPFVPRESWSLRQKTMNDADDSLDAAEAWGARAYVPYADGGAPWYWEAGLGPRLDQAAHSIPSVDPSPESAASAALHRSGSPSEGPIASPVELLVLRPGDGVTFEKDQPTNTHSSAWPYGQGRDPDAITRSGDTWAVIRKKVLLRLIARAEAERTGLEPEPAQVQATSDDFRRRYGLLGGEAMRAFLAAESVSLEAYSSFIADAALIEALEARESDAIDALVDAHIGISTARPRSLGLIPK